MLVSQYNGTAIDLSALRSQAPPSFRSVALGQWVYFSKSHCCPRCLEESGGVWKLCWKLPWSFACVRHGGLLLDKCPSCGGRTGLETYGERITPAYRALVLDPATCRNPQPGGQTESRRSPVPCGHLLANVEVPALDLWPSLLKTQSRLDQVLDGYSETVCGETVSPYEYLRCLRSLCAMLLSFGAMKDFGDIPPCATEAFLLHEQRRQDLRGRREESLEEGMDWRKTPRLRTYWTVPRSAALMAAILPTALCALDSDYPDDVAEFLQPFMDRARERWRDAPGIFASFRFPTRLEEIFLNRWNSRMKPAKRLETGPRTVRGAVGQPASGLKPYYVPQLLWQEEYQTSFAELLPGLRPDYARRFCSMALVKLGSDRTWEESATVLELPEATAGKYANKAIGILNTGGVADLFLTRMRLLAERVAADPYRIDYGARRRGLAEMGQISEQRWRSICGLANVHTGKPGGRRLFASVWLWCHLTGGDYRLCPILGQYPEHYGQARKLYRYFVSEELSLLWSSLVSYAREVAASLETTHNK